MKDIIEKSVHIQAPPERVWAALADAEAFGTWFHARMEGAFVLGQPVWLSSTYPQAEGARWWMRPVRMDPPQLFVFEWPGDDVSPPDSTGNVNTVTFTLEAAGEGTRVTVTESGFAKLPPEVAARKYPENTEGWEVQTANLKAHVEA